MHFKVDTLEDDIVHNADKLAFHRRDHWYAHQMCIRDSFNKRFGRK